MSFAAKQLAVPDISLARLPGQFKLSVTPDRQWVSHQIAGWSVGLRWLAFEYANSPHDPTSPLFVSHSDEQYLATVEQQPFEIWMQAHHRRHMEMHRVALGLGLEPGGGKDLPVERFRIDRLLKQMLSVDGVDMHGPAEAMASEDYYIEFLCNSMEYMTTKVGERRFQLTQAGRRLPELSAEIQLGSAIYRGYALDIDIPIPHVLRLGAVGRRLGDVVSTGSATLDRRIITAVVTTCDETFGYQLKDGRTRLQLNQDLVRLGAPTSRDR